MEYVLILNVYVLFRKLENIPQKTSGLKINL